MGGTHRYLRQWLSNCSKSKPTMEATTSILSDHEYFFMLFGSVNVRGSLCSCSANSCWLSSPERNGRRSFRRYALLRFSKISFFLCSHCMFKFLQSLCWPCVSYHFLSFNVEDARFMELTVFSASYLGPSKLDALMVRRGEDSNWMDSVNHGLPLQGPSIAVLCFPLCQWHIPSELTG